MVCIFINLKVTKHDKKGLYSRTNQELLQVTKRPTPDVRGSMWLQSCKSKRYLLIDKLTTLKKKKYLKLKLREWFCKNPLKVNVISQNVYKQLKKIKLNK